MGRIILPNIRNQLIRTHSQYPHRFGKQKFNAIQANRLIGSDKFCTSSFVTSENLVRF